MLTAALIALVAAELLVIVVLAGVLREFRRHNRSLCDSIAALPSPPADEARATVGAV